MLDENGLTRLEMDRHGNHLGYRRASFGIVLYSPLNLGILLTFTNQPPTKHLASTQLYTHNNSNNTQTPLYSRTPDLLSSEPSLLDLGLEQLSCLPLHVHHDDVGDLTHLEASYTIILEYTLCRSR